MNDEIKTRIQQALKEPTVPDSLVTRTIRQCQMVTAGREAEEMLASKGNNASLQERRLLAANSILGRLAQQNEVPEELSAQRLVQDQGFCRLVDRPPEKLLQDIQQGTLFREIVAEAKKNTPTAQNEKTLSQDPPVKKGPVRSGPSM